MQASATFWDRIAVRYSRKPVADEAAYREKLRVTQRYLRPDMDVLELGCGTGSTALEHAPHVRCIRAFDVSQKMLDIARAKAGARQVENVRFERAAVEEVAVPDGSQDAVLAMSLLHLLDDREPTIARIHRMLKPGGVFVSSTACIGGAMGLLRPVLAAGRMLGLLPLVRFFSPRELEASLVAAGFRIDYRWQPGRNAALFIVAVKPA